MVLGDLTLEDTPQKLVEGAVDRFGQLDGVVANAGFPVLKTFEEGSFSDLDYAFKGNVYSFFALAKAAGPYLSKSLAGRIVGVCSVNAHVFRNDMFSAPLSASSKGALETAVKSLALYFARSGVTVNCVVPGFVRKDIGTEHQLSEEQMQQTALRVPLGRMGKSSDVAAAIEFLLSPDAGHITSQSLHVDGGLV